MLDLDKSIQMNTCYIKFIYEKNKKLEEKVQEQNKKIKILE